MFGGLQDPEKLLRMFVCSGVVLFVGTQETVEMSDEVTNAFFDWLKNSAANVVISGIPVKRLLSVVTWQLKNLSVC